MRVVKCVKSDVYLKMADVSDSSISINEKIRDLSLNGNGTLECKLTKEPTNLSEYGMPLQEVYKLALSFYKGKYLRLLICK